jgi:long-chain acyl-CoA synthetase
LYETEGILTHEKFDAAFKAIKDQFGGRLRVMLSASAPISPDVLNFYKIALGIHVYECMGQTEVSGPALLTSPRDRFSSGHVGGLIPSNRLRLRDCPELGYLSTDNPPRGEIQYYGTNCFKGYFKNPSRTKEAFSDDGWVCSGDVGLILPNGAVKVIDRAKNIFKLS